MKLTYKQMYEIRAMARSYGFLGLSDEEMSYAAHLERTEEKRMVHVRRTEVQP